MARFLTLKRAFIVELLFTSFFAPGAKAQDIKEDWLILQGQYQYQTEHLFMLEYVKRDYDHLLSARPFLALARFSYGAPLKNGFQYFIGLAHLNFAEQSPEFRLHQNLLHFYRDSQGWLQVVQRWSLEQRKFESDADWITRIRYRIMLNPGIHYAVGPSLYNEAFYVLDGQHRFPSGINENRFGLGIRYTFAKQSHVFLYKTDAYLKTLRRQLDFDWWQLQVLYQF